MKRQAYLAILAPALLLATRLASAGLPGQLQLPSFDSLTGKSSQSVNITLDGTLLGLAASFLDSNKPEEAATMQVVSGLQGIYVRSYTFNKEFAYPTAEVEAVRKQLVPPTWQRLVQVRSRDQDNVDIYISADRGRADGLVIIASDPREFTIVNIVGSIDLQKLHQLEGKFGVPKLQLSVGK